MELYDDIDTKPRASQIDGWSSGIKMLQTQLAIKKAQVPKEQPKKPVFPTLLTLRNKKLPDDEPNKAKDPPMRKVTVQPLVPVIENIKTDDWDFVDEYDPFWPNEYDKLIKDKQKQDKDSRSSRENNSERKRARGRNNSSVGGASSQNSEPPLAKTSSFSQRHTEEDNYSRSPPSGNSIHNKGAAIAPPPSLQEISINNGDNSSAVTIPYSASSVAAKIMAKYGFRDGQGLGKLEQGMSVALQVEKTSKRGGRIIHEKDGFVPPGPAALPMPVQAQVAAMPPPPTPVRSPKTGTDEEATKTEPTITEIMKQPSKVVLLRNMVGPGDVDEELEPEVKDECNTKYGDVISVVIHEAFGTSAEDAVKIYVEFKRIESAIKAVVDLNGRFFGGRQVRAGFYNFDKFKSFQLN